MAIQMLLAYLVLAIGTFALAWEAMNFRRGRHGPMPLPLFGTLL